MVLLGPHHFLCHANLLLGTCTEAIADKGCGELRVGQQWPRLALFIASKLSNLAGGGEERRGEEGGGDAARFL